PMHTVTIVKDAEMTQTRTVGKASPLRRGWTLLAHALLLFALAAGVATAQAPDFVKYTGNPVLDGWGPSVLFDGTTYHMWYSLSTAQFGYATSTDGLGWTENGAVYSLGGVGTFDGGSLHHPTVVLADGVYKMWYTGNNGSGTWAARHATSLDGVEWSRHSPSPISGDSHITGGETPLVGSVLFDGSAYRMWFGASNPKSIHYATSVDGVVWTQRGVVLAPGMSKEFDDTFI
ncbi:MAG: hypothetical protein ABGY41_09770, partial [Candidatus Poribacteria bacterium]